MIESNTKFLKYCLGATLMMTGFSAQTNPTGVVRFYGAIIEPVCRAGLTTETRKIHLDCSARSDNTVFAAGDIAHSRLDYLDAKQTLAIVSVSYR